MQRFWDDACDIEGSAAFERWDEQLELYLDGQDGVDALRSWSQPHPPRPEDDNPMVRYLIDRSQEIHGTDGLQSALAWAVAHAWFESSLDTRASVIRQLGA